MESIELLVVIAMIFVNGIFAAYEIALASVSLSRLKALAESRRSGAQAAVAMKEGIEKSLAVVQLGITLVGLIAGATGGASAVDDVAPVFMSWGFSKSVANALALISIVVPLTGVTIVVGELLPKLFALNNKEWICLKLSPVMKGFAQATWPIIWVLENSASGLMAICNSLWKPAPQQAGSRSEASELQELRAVVSLARASRLIGPLEENIINGTARLAGRTLQEIMLPAAHIRTLNRNSSLTESLIIAHNEMHTRFPVTEHPGDPQSIVGYITFKDMISLMRISPSEPSLSGILRTIPRFRETLLLSEALEQLLREHTHIALVINSQGQVTGLVTQEDLFEELLGDIQDEHEFLPIHIIRTGQGWIVGGGARLSRFRDVTGIDLKTGASAQTINSWLIEQLGHTPVGGEIITSEGMRVLVRKTRRHLVLEALLTPITATLSSDSRLHTGKKH